LTIHPVWPDTVKPVGFSQPIRQLFEVLITFFACDEAAFNAHEYCHNAETRSAGCDDMLIVLRVAIVCMETLPCCARDRFGAVPEVLKGLVLYERHQRVVAEARLLRRRPLLASA